MNRDQKFFDMYSLVIGGLVVTAILLFILASNIADNTQGVFTRESAEYQAAVNERIRPVGDVYLPGEEQEQAAAPTVETVAEPEPVAVVQSGPQVYNGACIACHANGVAGAPITGDVEAWTARLAQGNEILYRHAIEGFNGEAGYMPAKGGNMSLSDEEVIAAVDYMIEESQ